MATDGEWGRGSDCKERGVGQSWPASTPPQSYLYITVSCLLIAHANLHPLLSPPHPPPPHTHTSHPTGSSHRTQRGWGSPAIVFVYQIFLFSYPATQSPAALPHHRLTPGWGALLHLGEEGRLGPDEAVRQDQADPGYGLLGREALRGHSCAMRDGMHIFYVRV